MLVRAAIAIAIVLACAPAYAQHDHAADEQHNEHGGHASSITAGASIVAASFDTMYYLGNYEGVVPSVRWSNSRFAVIGSGAVYRVAENGAEFYGLGDAAVHGQARVLTAGGLDAGVIAGVSIPIGDEAHGMGMGHVMAMPAAYGVWTHERVRLATTIGYSRTIGAEGHHDHGLWPLVSPMLMSEVSWSAGGDVRLTHAVTAGARAGGGLPTGDGGNARAMVGGRVAWHTANIDTAFELQAGIVGDPFTVRGVVSTMLSFE